MQPLNPHHHRILIMALALFGLTGGILAAADPVMYAADSVEPGDVLQVVVTGGAMDHITLGLDDERDRTVSRAEGFRWHSPTGRSVSVILLGIPSTAAPGRYSLVLNADQGRAQWRLEKSVTLVEVDFPEQVISMNDQMTDLYTDDSERKKAESRALWAVLTAFDPEAQYHFGTFQAPLDNGIPTAGFGDRRRFRMPDGSETSSVHFGSDLWAQKGTAVNTSGRGRVVLATERFLTGNTIVIEHLPGVFTMYYHMDSLEVSDGEMLEQGELIGTVGDTGFATGEHLHWEMRVGGTPVDPRPFLASPLLDTDALMGNM